MPTGVYQRSFKEIERLSSFMKTISKRKIGKKRTKEECQAISKGRIGMRFTQQHCENISRGKKGKKAIYSPEAREKLRSWLGKKHTEETKQKISAKNRGKSRSESLKKLISVLKRNNINMLGKHHSEITKLKIGQANKIFQNKPEYIIKNRERRLKQILPLTDTSIELKVKKQLEDNNINFIHPWNLEPYYQCDFFVPSMNLIIECDGDYWHSLPKTQRTDKSKNTYAKNKGYNMLRLPEHIIKKNNFNISSYFEKKI